MDDCKETTDLVKMILEMNQYSCAVANSAQECLTLLEKNKFDSILIDLAMPARSGLDLLKELEIEGKLSENKVAIFSSSPIYTDGALNGMVKKFGIGRMLKPFTEAELVDLVKKYVG